MRMKNMDELRDEVLLVFSKQFAENQRAREQMFIKIIGLLGAVIIGYSFVFHDSQKFDNIEFSFIAIICEILLFYGALIILSIAYNFRRDQTVNAKIRISVGVLGKNNIFPESFDPRTSPSLKKVHKWMPSFLSNFFTIFPILLILLVITYQYKLNLKINCENPNWLYTATVGIGLLLILIICYAYVSYYRKIKEFIDANKVDEKQES